MVSLTGVVTSDHKQRKEPATTCVTFNFIAALATAALLPVAGEAAVEAAVA